MPIQARTDPAHATALNPSGTYFVDDQGNELPLTPPPAPTPVAGGGQAQPTALADLIKQQGAGWSAAGNAAPKLDDTGTPVPGVYTVVLAGPNGAQRVATIYSPEALKGPTAFVRPDADLPKASFSVVTVEDTVKPPTETPEETNARVAAANAAADSSRAQADIAKTNLAKLQADQTQREKNEAAGKGYFTNDEVVTFDKQAKDQNLTQQQIDIQRGVASNNNKNSEISNQIALTNATIAAQNAATNDKATAARIKYEEHTGSLADTQALLDQAKFERDNADKDRANTLAQGKLELDQLSQKQANLTQQQQNVLRGQELQQRTAEAAQTAQTAATTAATGAAANVYGTERQAQTAAGQVGAGLLNQRVSAGQGMLGSVLNLAGSRPMAGNLPANVGQMLMSDIQGFATQLGGGQDVYDTAARLVRAADSQGGMTPMAQQAFALLTQAFDRHQQQTGQPAPEVAATIAAKASGQQNAMVAPVTTTAPTSPAPNQVPPGFNQYGPVMGTPGVGGPNAYAVPPTVPPVAPVRAFVAPLTTNNLANTDPRLRGMIY